MNDNGFEEQGPQDWVEALWCALAVLFVAAVIFGGIFLMSGGK
jgi:hypothetical protein